MNVKLISITQPLIEKDGVKLTPEQYIVYCARISNPSNQLNIETTPKLLKYCIDNKHWSIFEMINMSVEVKTSRAISPQILRHASLAKQEYSQRYSQVVDFEPLEWRSQGKTNRQVGDEELKLNETLQSKVDLVQKLCKDTYNELLESGIAKECARMILPLNSSTALILNGSVRSWIHYLQVRCDSHTQKEHRDIANKIKVIFIANFPDTSKALNFIPHE